MDVDFSGNDSSKPSSSGTRGGGGNGDGGRDDDFDLSSMLKQFSCMHTDDHESLINQFNQIVGSKGTPIHPEFWLDMNNWNLQAALGSYLDYESQNGNFMMKLPKMSFQTSPNLKQDFPPNHAFSYTATIVNTGDEAWPIGCALLHCGGVQMSKQERVLLPALLPGQTATVQLNLVTPEKGGYYYAQYRPATITGQSFGEIVFIIIQVLDDLHLVTQQLSDAHLVEMDVGSNGLGAQLVAAQRTSNNLAQSMLTAATAVAASHQAWFADDALEGSSSFNHNNNNNPHPATTNVTEENGEGDESMT